MAAASDEGVAALGLGGYEVGHPVEKFQAAFELAHQAELITVLHAGETEGPPSIWSASKLGRAARIGHGVRCLEDATLAQYLRNQQIPLEVCPSSNVCLRVVRDWADHPLPQLMAEGSYVTLKVKQDQTPAGLLCQLASLVEKVLLQRSHESCTFVMVAYQKSRECIQFTEAASKEEK